MVILRALNIYWGVVLKNLHSSVSLLELLQLQHRRCGYACRLLSTLEQYPVKSRHSRNTMRTGDKKHGHCADKQELRHLKRKKLQAVGNLTVATPSNISLQVMQSGCPGFGKSVHVVTTNSRYIVNCPEGTQRLCQEHKARMSRVEHLFFTRPTWANVGGLPGFGITIRDVGIPELIIHGPPNIGRIFEAARIFDESGEGFPVRIVQRNCFTDNEFKDEAFTIRTVPLLGRKLQRSVDMMDSDVMESIGQEHSNSAADNATSVMLDHSCDHDVAVSYIFHAAPRPGKMNLQKCLDMGIPVGPLLGKLQQGETVTLPDGRQITADEVQDPVEPPPVFAVVDCPSLDFIPSLQQSTDFQAIQRCERTTLLVHFAPESVFRSAEYVTWMAGFAPTVDHLVLNERCESYPHSEEVYRMQTKLGIAHPDIFPQLQSHPLQRKHVENTPGCLIYAEPLLRYDLRPLGRFSLEDCLTIDKESYTQEATAAPTFSSVFANSQRYVSGAIKGSKYPELVFLGTGSAVPGKSRNVSCILFNISADCSLLMDCGEASYMQLVYFYGIDELPNVLRRIKGIFISHMHADHHLGLYNIMLARHQAFQQAGLQPEQCAIIAGGPLFKVHDFYGQIVEDIRHMCVRIPSMGVHTNEQLRVLAQRLGVAALRLVKVFHPQMAYGLVIKLADERTVVYSGDTRPCPDLITAGRGAFLLIHEATMEDDLAEDAVRKRHSTLSEAIQVGQDMGAEHTLLTHFSGRYSRVPLMRDDFESKNVGIAFDHMRVSLDQLDILPKLGPLYRVIFAEYHEMLEDIREKRQLRRELKAKMEAAEKLTSIA